MSQNQAMGGASNLRLRLFWLAVAGFFAGAGGAVMVALSNQELNQPAIDIVLRVFTGWSWLGVGIFACWRRPDNAFGKWMVLTSFAWMAQVLVYANSSLVFTFGLVVASVFPFALVQTLVRFPTGRIESRTDRRVLQLVVVALSLVLLATFFGKPSQFGFDRAPQNLLLLADSPTTVTVLFIITNAIAIVLVLALIHSFTTKYSLASPPMRRLIGPVLWTSTTLLALLGMASVFSIAGLDRAEDVAGAISTLNAAVLPFAFLVGLARSKLVRGQALGRMLERVAHESDPVKMQEAVAVALGDPSVELIFWLPATRQYVDARGLPTSEPDTDSGRATSVVSMEGRKVALIVHDGALLEEPEKIEAVSRGAALAFENARLEAEVRAKVAELRASRTRIVEAGDAARREIERNLHDGAQQNLVSLALKLQMARSRVDSDPREAIEILDGASAELEQTLAELRELARGIHPAVLSD
ncbi:MAG: histidine kinase dimerization/phosphoacceptor domain-containing protein, partial [Solirubrobacterales bacterium]|nr:histidine kinase dimerization/phosphoacceptor domain-containing protein [Solirubrobacterales bacterium]